MCCVDETFAYGDYWTPKKNMSHLPTKLYIIIRRTDTPISAHVTTPVVPSVFPVIFRDASSIFHLSSFSWCTISACIFAIPWARCRNTSLVRRCTGTDRSRLNLKGWIVGLNGNRCFSSSFKRCKSSSKFRLRLTCVLLVSF